MSRFAGRHALVTGAGSGVRSHSASREKVLRA
jgi:NAD(P)-dependent dehydrogenase (short-subunit alcohol dehydrogenase family)